MEVMPESGNLLVKSLIGASVERIRQAKSIACKPVFAFFQMQTFIAAIRLLFHTYGARVFYVCRKYRCAIFPESRQKHLAKRRS